MKAEEFYRVEYHKTDDGVIPTVWMGVQGFDLREQQNDGEILAQEKAEWFAEMFKKAIDNYADQEYQNKVNAISDEDNPWSLIDVIKKLMEATNILLHEKDFDGHGWEEMEHCLNRGNEIINKLLK